MSLIEETIDLLQNQLGESLPQMRVEGLVVGVFFTGVKLTGKFAGMERTPVEEALKILPHVDVIILTGSTIVNHTIDGLLSLVRRGCQVAVVGPTASMMPQPFFKRGVSLMGGMRITDPDSALRMLAEGGSGYHIVGEYGQKMAFLPLG